MCLQIYALGDDLLKQMQHEFVCPDVSCLVREAAFCTLDTGELVEVQFST